MVAGVNLPSSTTLFLKISKLVFVFFSENFDFVKKKREKIGKKNVAHAFL